MECLWNSNVIMKKHVFVEFECVIMTKHEYLWNLNVVIMEKHGVCGWFQRD